MTAPAAKNLFICAAGHSGSTLLDLLLGSHSRATSLGEVTQLPKNLALNTSCTCGSPVRACDFWKAVAQSLAKRLNIDMLSHPYALDLGFIDARVVVDVARQTRLYALWRKLVTGMMYASWRYNLPIPTPFANIYIKAMDNNLSLYDAVREVSGCSVIVDSTKHYMKAVGLYRQAPENTRVILLTRDGRGVFYSNLKRGFGQKASLESWLTHYARALPLFEKQLPPSAVMQVRYEDLCCDPASTLERICSFVGLAFEPTMLDFSQHKHHIANGNDMRFLASSEIRCDERWREEMSQEDITYFKRSAWEMNCRLGYSD